MTVPRRLIAGSAVAFASMVLLFLTSVFWPGAFVTTTFFSTSCMLLASYAQGLRWTKKPSARVIVAGVVSALVLYLIFVAGGQGVKELHPFGMGTASVTSVYSLIVSPANPPYLQAVILLFDAAGYESFFRGVLQARLKPSMGVGAAPAVAAIDATIHIITLNPLWVTTTFVADLVWGLTYHYGKDLTASFTSHLLWDVMIFMAFPLG